MSMPELSETVVVAPEQATTVVETQMVRASQRAANFVFGAQKLMLEELVFASNELVERAQTEIAPVLGTRLEDGRSAFRQGREDYVRGMR